MHGLGKRKTLLRIRKSVLVFLDALDSVGIIAG